MNLKTLIAPQRFQRWEVRLSPHVYNELCLCGCDRDWERACLVSVSVLERL